MMPATEPVYNNLKKKWYELSFHVARFIQAQDPLGHFIMVRYSRFTDYSKKASVIVTDTYVERVRISIKIIVRASQIELEKTLFEQILLNHVTHE